mgnify:CR=1 FL=1
MERAIVSYASEHAAEAVRIRSDWRLVREYDLTRDLLAVTHCWQSDAGGDVIVAAKGAPEAIAKLCRFDESERRELAVEVDRMAADGMRVLAVAVVNCSLLM